MKQLLPALILISAIFFACKKDKPQTPDPTPVPNPGDTLVTGPGTGTGGGSTNGALSITGISPASGLPNTVVTISGSNFGNTVDGLTVRFNGVVATIQSVTPTAIKVLVPKTTTGNIVVILGDKAVQGPVFTYLFPELSAPYITGDVTLHNQAEVEAFVALNKGKELHIDGSLFIGASNLVSNVSNDITSLDGLTIIRSVKEQVFFYRVNMAEASFLNALTAAGSIYINTSDFSSLSFNSLQSFTGSLTLSGLPNLTSFKIPLQPAVGNIIISLCPLLSDLSFLNPVVSANLLSVGSVAATSIALDQLQSVRTTVTVSGSPKLTSVSFPSLKVIGDAVTLQGGSLAINYCPLVTTINCTDLTAIGGKLTLRGLNIRDMTGFRSLTRIGALLLDDNDELADLRGLEQLTSLTMTGIVTATISGTSPISRVNGVYISNHAKLASLQGLQNISTIPIAYITGNPQLNDLCPFKTSVNALSKLPAYSFKYTDQFGRQRTSSIAALTLTQNGKYATTADALAAVAGCQ